MSDDAKPKAGFLSGKKAPAPVKEAEPEQRPVPVEIDPSEMAGFLKKPSGKPPESPVPNQAPPVQQAQPAQQKQAAPAARPAAAKAMAPARPAPAAPVAPAPVAGNRALAEEFLHKGLDHYDRQESEEALGAYQSCIEADPGFALGYNNLGMVLIDLERYDEAIASLYESIRCDPTYAEAYNNLGFVLRRMNRHVEAACAYTQFLQIEPEIEEGARIQGWIDSVIRDNGLTGLPPFAIPSQAEPEPEPPPPAKVEEAPKAKIKKMAAWEVAAGNVETAAPVSAIGEVGDASELLRTASALPSTPRPNLAGMAPPAAAAAAPKPAAAAQMPAAAAQAQKRPASSPARPAAAINPVELIEKGMDAFGNGDLETAMGLFKQTILTHPENAEAHSGLGKALIRMERFDEGIEELKIAVQYDPNDPAPYYVLGFALRAIERNVEAADAYDAFLRLMPDALETGKMRDWVIRIKGAPAVAPIEDTFIDDEQIVTETDKRSKTALTKFQEGDVDTSLRECVKILNEDPGHFRTRVLLGRIYLRQKAYDNAIEQLEGALVTRPDYPEALYFLGQAAEKRGTLDAATASYTRYIDVAPQGPRAERLNEWLLKHASGEVAATSQIQCELCLRFFPGGEMTQHEGKATCRNCLVVMGAAPSIEAHAPAAKSDKELARTELPGVPGGSKKLLFAGAGFGAVAAVFALLFLTHRLDPLLRKLKLIPPVEHKIEHDTSTDIAVSPNISVNTANIKISGEPKLQVQPYAVWTYQPGLDGAAELDAKAAGWTAEYKLKDGPPGMEFKDKTLVWMPAVSDYAALKAGSAYPVSFSIKGSIKLPDGHVQELFAFSKAFTLNGQFSYEVGAEQDLQIDPVEPVALTACDLNGDGQQDVVAASNLIFATAACGSTLTAATINSERRRCWPAARDFPRSGPDRWTETKRECLPPTGSAATLRPTSSTKIRPLPERSSIWVPVPWRFPPARWTTRRHCMLRHCWVSGAGFPSRRWRRIACSATLLEFRCPAAAARVTYSPGPRPNWGLDSSRSRRSPMRRSSSWRSTKAPGINRARTSPPQARSVGSSTRPSWCKAAVPVNRRGSRWQRPQDAILN